MRLSIDHQGANRTVVSIGVADYFFSYSTCVAFRKGKRRARRDHNYSRTTAKHMGQMGVTNWPQLNDETFEVEAGL